MQVHLTAARARASLLFLPAAETPGESALQWYPRPLIHMASPCLITPWRSPLMFGWTSVIKLYQRLFTNFALLCRASLPSTLAKTVDDLPPFLVSRQHTLNTKSQRKHSAAPYRPHRRWGELDNDPVDNMMSRNDFSSTMIWLMGGSCRRRLLCLCAEKEAGRWMVLQDSGGSWCSWMRNRIYISVNK